MHGAWRCVICACLLTGCFPVSLTHEETGDDFLSAGRYAEAVFEYTCALQSMKSADLLLHRGRAWEGLGRFDHAIADYDSALRIDPTSIEGYLGRGAARIELILAEASLPVEATLRPEVSVLRILALSDLDIAVMLDPRDAQTYRTRAYGRFHLGDFQGAMTDLDRVLKIATGDLWTYTLRGKTHQAVGDWKASTEDFTRVIRYSPWKPEGYALRGLGYLRSGQFPEALRDLTMSLQLDSLDARNWYYRALARIPLEDLEGACADACRGRSLGDPDAEALARSLACECP